jgi:hypothetical protein
MNTTETAATEPRSATNDALVIVAAAGAVAAAVWLEPASTLIVGWPAAGPERIALLAPVSRLVWAAATMFALTIGLLVFLDGPTRRFVATLAAPLCLLWLWVIPYLPWLPDRLPLLLALAGPIRWIVAAGAALGVVTSSGMLRGRFPVWERGPGRWTVFAASLVMYLVFGSMHARDVGPGGDEPHYLVIAHSLLADRDLKIENNHQRGDYRAFYGGPLRPDYMARGADGEIYSIHSPGLPAVLLPFYAAAGYGGALLMMCLIAALTALAVFDLAETIAGRSAAWLAWAAVCLTVPFVPHSWLIFPEVPGALLAAWAALWLWKPLPERATTWLWRGAALALWPWLHTKYVVLLALFAAALLFRLRRTPRAIASFVAPNAISGVLWLYSFYLLYGTIDPQAPYGTYTSQFVLFENIPRGLLGLLFDQKFGLLFYSPVYVLSAVGAWLALRRPDVRFASAALLLTAGAFVISTTRLYMWWGGSSAPARFMVPILPCLAPFIALAIQRLRDPVSRTLLAVALAVSLGFAWIGAGWPDRLFLFSDPHGRARTIEALQSGSTLAGTLPTFTEEDWLGPLKPLAAWTSALALAGLAMLAAARWASIRATFWLGTLGSVVFLLVATVATANTPPAARAETAFRGVLNLLWNYDGERHRAFHYQKFETVALDQLLKGSVLPLAASPTGTVPLPPGSFEARVSLASGTPHHGELRVRSQQNVTFGRVQGALDDRVTVPFDLPVDVGRVIVDTPDQALARRIGSIEIVARSIVPRHLRDTRDVRTIEAVEGWPGGYIAYLDDRSYPEKGVFWTRGSESATILVAPRGASLLTLTLFIGPRRGAVSLSVAGEQRLVTLDAGSVHVLEIPVPPGRPLIPVTVRSEGTFRPSDVDSESDDVRWLGCQVRVGLR